MSAQSWVAECFEFCCRGFNTTGNQEQVEGECKSGHLHQHRQQGQWMGLKMPEKLNYTHQMDPDCISSNVKNFFLMSLFITFHCLFVTLLQYLDIVRSEKVLR